MGYSGVFTKENTKYFCFGGTGGGGRSFRSKDSRKQQSIEKLLVRWERVGFPLTLAKLLINGCLHEVWNKSVSGPRIEVNVCGGQG